MRKRILLIPLALLLAVSLVACAAPAPAPTAPTATTTVTAPTATTTVTAPAATTTVTAPAPEPPYVSEWILPSLALLGGAWAAYGVEGEWVKDLVAKEINAAGGIRGIPIKRVSYDSGYDTAKAVQQMARILDLKPLVIAGIFGDTPQGAALPMAVKQGVFTLDGNGDPNLFPQNAPWGVSLSPTIEQFTPVAARHYVKLHGDEIRSVAIFTNLSSTTIERQADQWKMVLEDAGITVYPYIECPTDLVDFKPVVLKAMGYGADAFINVVGPDQAAKIDIELYKNGIEGWRIVNYLATNAPALYDIGEGYLEDTYTYDLINPYLKTEKWQTFLAEYRAWRKDPEMLPTYYGVYDYDILYIIKDAFEAENITGDPAKLTEERIKIRDYINNLAGYDGLQGEFSIVNSTALKPVTFFQIKDNRPIPIATLPTGQ